MKTICNRGTEKQTHFLGLLKKKNCSETNKNEFYICRSFSFKCIMFILFIVDIPNIYIFPKNDPKKKKKNLNVFDRKTFNFL